MKTGLKFDDDVQRAAYEGAKKALQEFFEEFKGLVLVPQNDDLTPYQRSVLNDLKDGQTASQIAKKHGVTSQAVRNMKNKLIVKGYLPRDFK